jgi:sarcosine oxidase
MKAEAREQSAMYDAIVVGVGGMGSAALYHLASRGARVLGLEQFGLPHDLGSSHGLSRIIRLAYWEHADYVPLVRRAYDLWRALEIEADEQLLVVTGSIDAGLAESRHLVGARAACQRFDLAYRELDSTELTAEFPGYRLPESAHAIYQPEGGLLIPERCIAAHADIARRRGAELCVNESVLGWDVGDKLVRVRTTRGVYEGARLVLTAGAWTGPLVPRLATLLSPERQVMLWTRPLQPALFEVGAFPVFYINLGDGPFYGYPIHGLPAFKIGRYHHRAEAVSPDTMDRECHPADEETLRDGIRRYFPDANGPTVAMKTCMFTNTPDEHFVIDVLEQAPRVCVAAGFSGHGFKFCSVVGEVLADLALEGGTGWDVSLFSLTRK